MCGIVAIIQKRNNGFLQKEVDIFTQLLFVGQLRGSDGTGIFFNSKKGKAHIRSLKCAITASNFINIPEYKVAEKVLFNDANFAVGHNRFATKGKIDNECTHPFKSEHITLVHNGTLYSHKTLADVEVDSHAICESISKNGAKQTLKEIDGAFSLVWFDSKERALFLCHNKDRPLAMLDCGNFYMIVSELSMGLWIAERNRLMVKSSLELPLETLYRFPLPEMEKFTIEKVEYRKSYVMYTKPNYAAQNFDDDYDYNRWYTRPMPLLPAITQKYKSGDTVKFMGGTIDSSCKNMFLRGDFYIKDQQEFQWRIKVFGKEADLRLLAHKPLIGKIGVFDTYNGKITYTVHDVKLFIKSNSNVIPIKKEKEEELTKCGLCEFFFAKKDCISYTLGNDQFPICPDCQKSVNIATKHH
jgi:predicted glutamine amidotransferase